MTITANDIQPVKINHKFQPLFLNPSPTRYFLLTGGRAGAKSHTVSVWACDALRRYPAWRILYTRYTLTSAEISIIPEFSEKLELLKVFDQFHVTKRLIENKVTGSDIIFSGIKTSSGNQTAKLKSIPRLNVLIVEEGEEFESEADFDIIDQSIRVDNAPNIIIIVMNPPTSEHWVYKRWIEQSHRSIYVEGHRIPISTHPNVTHIHTTYLDAKEFLSASYLEQIEALKITNPDKYAHYFLGCWRERAEGAIFTNWREDVFNWSLPYAYGLDFGYFPDPTAMPVVAVDEKKKLIYAKELFYEDQLSTKQLIDKVGKAVRNKRDLIIADHEKRNVRDLWDNGFNVQLAEKGPDSVKNGIRKMQDYAIIVDPESQNLKKELNNYTWNDKKSDTPIDDYNHLIDAIRYAFTRLTAKKRRGVKRRN